MAKPMQLYSSTAKYEASAQDLPTVSKRASVIFLMLEQTPEVAGLLLNDGTDELMVSRDELQRQFPTPRVGPFTCAMV